MCGIVGVISKQPVNQLIYDALLLLQQGDDLGHVHGRGRVCRSARRRRLLPMGRHGQAGRQQQGFCVASGQLHPEHGVTGTALERPVGVDH